MSNGADELEVCRRFFDAIECKDIASVIEIYSPAAVIWHNTDERETDVDENLDVLRGMATGFLSIHYMDRRIQAYHGGFVQQHVLVTDREDGTQLRLPAPIICEVRDGRIMRLDEYLCGRVLAQQIG